MKTKIAAALAGLLLVCACATTGPQEEARTYPPGPALWVVRDADSTMYLFGTMHIRRPGQDWGGPNAQAGLAEADEVWTEMIMSPEMEVRAQQLAVQRGMSQERRLSSLLTEEQNARLTTLMEGYGMPMQMVDMMEPWFAAITLSVLPMLEAGYDPEAGADQQIDASANAAGKTMRAFETAEQQIGFLADFPLDIQVQWLVEAIDQAEQGSELFDGMAESWEAGDLAELERLVVDEWRLESPEVYEVLLVRRNNAWVETLLTELQGEGVDFVAVGAAHMLGDDGLVAQLRAHGYSVERLDP